MAQPFKVFDPTTAVASHVDVTVNEGCGLRLWNESNVTLQFETTYGDFFYLPAWTEDVFTIHYKITQLDWEQFFIIQGTAPSDSRVYGIIYTKDETAELNWSGSRPIQRWLNVGNDLAVMTATAQQLINESAGGYTTLIEARPLGGPDALIFVDNSGNVAIKEHIGTTVTLFEIIPGNTTGVLPSVKIGGITKDTEILGNTKIDGNLWTVGEVSLDGAINTLEILPGFTDGAIFLSAQDGLAPTKYILYQDPTHLIWDYSNQRLGINTAIPTVSLDVVGSIKASGTVGATGTISGSNHPAGASITGNGTIATGGFTLTIPATGTAALKGIDNGFTAIQTITLTDTATSTRPALITLNHRTSGVPIAGYGLQLLLRGDTDNNTLASFGQFNFSWIVPTNGTQTARIQAFVMDAAGPREGWRIDASGTAPMIGFLGANAVVRQTGGVLTAGAAYTANEQGMINSIWTALRNYGLLT